jgi:hypothetical protein
MVFIMRITPQLTIQSPLSHSGGLEKPKMAKNSRVLTSG